MTGDAIHTFRNTIRQNRLKGNKGVYSVCSAHPEVLFACFLEALEDHSMILVESTSNQVDQYGGYTGMLPSNFVRFVQSIASRIGFPREMILFGGDHLGPNPWKHLPAEQAMSHAEKLVESYVLAGYRKIHLDTSMRCADDPNRADGHPDNQLVAERTVQLCQVAEKTWEKRFNSPADLVYVIGTEVPVPGGATEHEEELTPTDAGTAGETLRMNHECFKKAGLENAWDRVCAMVVQPGVEFGDDQVIRYKPENGGALGRWILDQENLVFEAHSTDYQTESALRALVADHFGILKVGPWLTFAYREAVFALEAMEKEMPETLGSRSNLSETLDYTMKNDDRYWKAHYKGEDALLRQKRRFSFSDRSRYYWGDPLVHQAIDRLMHNLSRYPAPLCLISQFLPLAFEQIAEGKMTANPYDMVHSHIRKVTRVYSGACGWKQHEPN